MKDRITFLVLCDSALNIVSCFWQQPLYLFPPYQKDLNSFFDKDNECILTSKIHQTLENGDVFFCNQSLKLIKQSTPLYVCILSVSTHFLIFGMESKENDDPYYVELMKGLVQLFMKVIRDSNNNLLNENEQRIRTQFEEIQRLNNALLNMQRQQKKANHLLNRINQDLNNRLVKDALTGLVSRYQYRDEIERTISLQPDQLGIFMFIDIDDFKKINDTYGHHLGDRYLITFAERLKSLKLNNFICIRISGDEFGVFTHGYQKVTEDDTQKIWDHFKSVVLDPPVEMDKIQLEFRCSLGMSIYGKDTTEIYDLIEYADFAMYEAKKKGKNKYKVFDAAAYQKKINSLKTT